MILPASDTAVMRFADESHGTLDFNGLAPAIIVSTGATFILENLDLRGLATPKSYNYSYYPYLLGIWPSMATQANSTVRFQLIARFRTGSVVRMGLISWFVLF